MAGERLSKATAALRAQQNATDYAVFGSGNTKVAQPDPVGYNVFAPKLGDALVGQSNDLISGPLAMGELRLRSDAEAARYDAALKSAQAAQLVAQRLGVSAEVAKAIIENTPELAKVGLTGNFEMPNDPTTGQPIVKSDPVLEMGANRAYHYGVMSDGLKDRAGALKDARDAGVTVDAPTANKVMSNYLTDKPETGYGLFAGNRTPTETAQQTTADAATLNAQAHMKDVEMGPQIAAINASGRNNSSGDNDDPIVTTEFTTGTQFQPGPKLRMKLKVSQIPAMQAKIDAMNGKKEAPTFK